MDMAYLYANKTRGGGGRGGGGGKLLLFLVLVAWMAGHSQSVSFEYALQLDPVEFHQDPESQAVLIGTSVTFSCVASAQPLLSGYPNVTIDWRLDGEGSIDSRKPGTSIRSNYLGHSELTISGVTPQDAGLYECLAMDGFMRRGHFRKWHYITASRRARLEVISPQPVDLDEHREVSLGEPLHLPCQTGVPTDSLTSFRWFKDGTAVEDSEMDAVSLSDVSLLVPTTSEFTAGSYWCTVWINSHPINSTIFTVATSQEEYAGPAHLFIDPPSLVQVSAGQSLNLTCYVTSVTHTAGGYRVSWLFANGTSISEETVTDSSTIGSLKLKLDGSSASADYVCEVTVGAATYRSNATSVLIVEPPIISGDQVREKLVDNDSTTRLSCTIGEGNPTPDIYWYKNGELVSNATGSTIPSRTHLILEGDLQNDILGVYQCFAENVAGSAVQTTRVLLDGFSNPPVNIKCELNATGRNKRIHVNWEVPRLYRSSSITIPQGELVAAADYWVEYHGPVIYDEAKVAEETHYEHTVDSEGEVSVKVRVLLPSRDTQSRTSAPATCKINTLDRVTEAEHNLTEVECTSELVHFRWDNPATIGDLWIQDLAITGTCIFGNSTFQPNEIRFEERRGGGNQEEYWDLTLLGVSEGSVCLFGGNYVFGGGFAPQDVTKVIPSATCVVPYHTQVGIPTVGLNLTCENSTVIVSWAGTRTVENINIMGRCLSFNTTSGTVQSELLKMSPTSEHNGSQKWIVDALSPDTVACSFFGSYITVEGEEELNPLQCVMREPVELPPRPTSTSPTGPTSNDLPSISRLSPSGTPSVSADKSGGITDLGLWWFMIAGGLLVLLVLLIALLLYLRWWHCRRPKLPFTKQQEEDAQAVAEEMFGRKQGVSKAAITTAFYYPYTGLDPDSMSQITVYHSTYTPHNLPSAVTRSASQHSMQSTDDNGIPIRDGKPDIFDRFLNSQQQSKVWDGGTGTAATSPTGTGSVTNEGADNFASPLTSAQTVTPEACGKNETPPVVIVDQHVHRIVSSSQTTSSSGYGTSSSGYGTDSYFVSDTSCSYPTSYFASRVREIEDMHCLDEGLPSEEKAQKVEEGPMNSTFESRAKETNLCTSESDIEEVEDVPEGTQSSTDVNSNPVIEVTGETSALTRDLTLHLQIPKTRQTKRNASLSPHLSMYDYTDDEGYVHMCSAERADIDAELSNAL